MPASGLVRQSPASSRDSGVRDQEVAGVQVATQSRRPADVQAAEHQQSAVKRCRHARLSQRRRALDDHDDGARAEWSRAHDDAALHPGRA